MISSATITTNVGEAKNEGGNDKIIERPTERGGGGGGRGRDDDNHIVRVIAKINRTSFILSVAIACLLVFSFWTNTLRISNYSLRFLLQAEEDEGQVVAGIDDTNTLLLREEEQAIIVAEEEEVTTSMDLDNPHKNLFDDYVCGSPEYKKDSRFICSFDSTELGTRIQQTMDGIYTTIESYNQSSSQSSPCTDLIVYGVAFGEKHVQGIQKEKENEFNQQLLKQHNHCFFMFVLEDDDGNKGKGNSNNRMTTTTPVVQKSNDGLDWLVPVPVNLLPYKEMRRNAKFFKYMGHWLFQNTRKVIWQDAKFRREEYMKKTRPNNYNNVGNDEACVTFMGLPNHFRTVGKVFKKRSYPKYMDHCKHVVASLKKRPGVTDSPEALMAQCDLYSSRIISNNNSSTSSTTTSGSTLALDNGLVDTAIIVWNNDIAAGKGRGCRKFNAKLQCNIMKEINCHSDRDQMTLPYVLASNTRPLYTNNSSSDDTNKPVLRKHPHTEPLQFTSPLLPISSSSLGGNSTATTTDKQPRGRVAVHITEPSRHWYYGAYLENNLQKGGFAEKEEVISMELDGTPKGLFDDTECGSPEYKKDSRFICSLDNTKLGARIQQTMDGIYTTIEPSYNNHSSKSPCPELVVYGVAFGKSHLKEIQNETENEFTRQLLKQHNHCFFMFVLEDDDGNKGKGNSNNRMTTTTPVVQKSNDGLDWLVPVPVNLLPYKEMRRNAKFFKYMGHWLFHNTKKVIWQDAKFRREEYMKKTRPNNYNNVGNDKACVTYMGLPNHFRTVGKIFKKRSYPKYMDHCKHVVKSLKKRPGVTDSPEALMAQCDLYSSRIINSSGSGSTLALDNGLVDTAIIVWNNDVAGEGRGCREFNAKLQCNIMEEINCHSDRDQITFPYVLASTTRPLHNSDLKNSSIDTNDPVLRKHPHTEPLQFTSPLLPSSSLSLGGKSVTAVHITEPSRHWYYGAYLENQLPALATTNSSGRRRKRKKQKARKQIRKEKGKADAD